MALDAQILIHLNHIVDPCTIQDIAHALGLLEPGDSVPERLRSTLTGLVRHQQIKRHHTSDGVLRYTARVKAPAPSVKPLLADVDAVPAVNPSPSPGLEPTPVVKPLSVPPQKAPVPFEGERVAKAPYKMGVADSVLAAFIPGDRPVMRFQISRRLGTSFSVTQVNTALGTLKNKGLLVKTGTTSNAHWSLASDAGAPPPLESRSPSMTAAHAKLLQARAAIDAALRALEG